MSRTKRTAKTRTVVADICLYGTSRTGAGYLAMRTDRRMFGTGEPVADRTFSEAVWRAQHDLREAGTPDGIVRVFDAGGERMAQIGLNEATIYGALPWEAAPVYVISAEALIAASTEPS